MAIYSKELRAAATLTADAVTASLDTSFLEPGVSPGDLTVYLDADDPTGTSPTLDATIQISPQGKEVADASSRWYAAGAFTQITDPGAATNVSLSPTRLGKKLRVNLDTGGSSPSYGNTRVVVTYPSRGFSPS